MSKLKVWTKVLATGLGVQVAGAGLVGCSDKHNDGGAAQERPTNVAKPSADMPEMSLDEGQMGRKDVAAHRAAGQYQLKTKKVADELGPGGSGAVAYAAAPAPVKTEDKKPPDGAPSAKEEEPSAPSRAWFPETFLFEPLVVTDDTGAATVKVRVPDRLTTWHVLALAHTREGAQGGAVASFLGTLPTYVDPVVPKFLVTGDEIELPVQLINTTDSPVSTALKMDADGAQLTAVGGPRTIPADGSLIEHAQLKAPRAGTVTLHVGLGSTDAVTRTFEIVPAGKPMTEVRSGTLAAPRELTIEGAAGSDPNTDKARLYVLPGALSLLRTELAGSTAREGVAADAYALLLAGKADGFLQALGDKADPDAIRTLTIVSSQRVLHDGRTLDPASAALIAEAALAHPESPVLVRLGERAATYLQQNQRPDGTFAGGKGWTLQRVLVATAECTRAVQASATTDAGRQRAKAVAARASGAFERNLARVEDGYTAAAILASGAATGDLAEKLRVKVRAAIVDLPDGSKYLDVPSGVVRADNTIPGRAEATALAVLALEGDPKASSGGSAPRRGDPTEPLLADLGATLIGSYDPAYGWGDGRANLAAMVAVLHLFKDPVPPNVKITLSLDGKPIVEGVLDRDKLRQVLVMEAPTPSGISGAHRWSITADPPVPGLGYSLKLLSWVPWEKETTHAGLELELPERIDAIVGKATDLAVTAIAPSGIELHIEQALPAGVQVDTPSLDALVSAQQIERYIASDGNVEFFVAPLQPGQVFSVKYKAVATLAGTLHSSASTITAGTNEFHVPPTTWTIK